MATAPGCLASTPLWGVPQAGMQVLWDEGRADIFAPHTDVAPPWSGACAPSVSDQPSFEGYAERSGCLAPSFLDDYYYRIYLTPTRIDFGNLATPTTRTVYVWNAFRTPVTIYQLDGDTAGLALGFMPPASLRSLQAIDYTVTATLDGPSFVDTLLTLYFSQGGTRTLEVLYGAALVASFSIDWGAGFEERLQWLTDVLTTRTGVEQRVRLRAQPRRALAYEVWEHGDGYGALDLLLASWQARVYVVPVWPHKAILPAGVAAGALAIATETADRDYYAGGLAVLGAGAMQTEVLQIEAVAADGLTLSSPVISAWPPWAWIAPARTGRFQASQAVSRPTAAFSRARLAFELTDLIPVLPELADLTYGDYPVLTRRPDRSEDVSVDYLRLVETQDNDTGAPVYRDLAGRPFWRRTFSFLLPTRADIAAFRAWAYARAGRAGPFWALAWERIIKPTSAIAADDLTVEVRHRGFSTYYADLPGRQDVAFLHQDGTWYFRHVSAWEYAGGVVEHMVLTESLGRDCTPADFALVCFLELSRLEADAVEIAYETDSVARVALAIRSIAQ